MNLNPGFKAHTSSVVQYWAFVDKRYQDGKISGRRKRRTSYLINVSYILRMGHEVYLSIMEPILWINNRRLRKGE